MTATAFNDRYEQAETVNIWPAPDMSVLSSGRRDPPVMPKELFGPVWPMLQDMAQGAGAPVDYLGVSFLAVVASLIGGRRRVKPYAEADWSEPCILWAGLVGDPSSNKSPVLDRTTNVLREMERDHAADPARAYRQLTMKSPALCSKWDQAGGLPVCKHVAQREGRLLIERAPSQFSYEPSLVAGQATALGKGVDSFRSSGVSGRSGKEQHSCGCNHFLHVGLLNGDRWHNRLVA